MGRLWSDLGPIKTNNLGVEKVPVELYIFRILLSVCWEREKDCKICQRRRSKNIGGEEELSSEARKTRSMGRSWFHKKEIQSQHYYDSMWSDQDFFLFRVNVVTEILDAGWNCVNGWICLKFPRRGTLRPQKRKSFKFLHSNFSFTQSASAFQTASLDQNNFLSRLQTSKTRSR